MGRGHAAALLLLLAAHAGLPRGACSSAADAGALQPAHSAAQAEPAPGRRRLKGGALSNSNGCLVDIPKCEPGACATRNVMGVARWACLRCLANYAPVVDASGQDNIVQCVCPRGFFENGTRSSSCTRCPVSSYCPGGEQAENPASRGSIVSCGSGLVTRNTGARSQGDCVAPAGSAMTSPTAATPCGRSEYAPMYNRLAKCLRCQSGLEEPLASGLANNQRNSKRAVCKLPPGKFMSQGLVRICPQGFYRENYVPFDAAVGTLCLPCNPGITTNGAGAKLASECSRVLPGYGIDEVFNVTGPASIPALPQDASGLPNATVCDLGFYSSAGFCAECPSGTVTRVRGAKSIEECAVPPGYVLHAGTMRQCASGFFRSEWLMFSDPRAAACTRCGDNIASEPRDLDENPRAASGSLVRATLASCFIEAGQGMIARGANLFAAMDCPANAYGAAGKVYGMAAAPCKPCPRNMITDGATKVNNSDACINDDGFGYASEGASRCAPGFYSAKGSRKPCQQCAAGRTTLDRPSSQRFATDCLVKPGFGVVDSAANATDAFSVDVSGLSNASAAALPVLECPLGYFGAGGALGATCQRCPEGSTTEDAGQASLANCSICIAGYGQLALSIGNAASCTPCDYGAYHAGGGTACVACPAATFYPPVDGVGDTWTSNGMTLFTGAKGAEFCVPQESQLSPDAGQAYFSAAVEAELLTVVPRADLAACIAACPRDAGCLVQFNASGLCKYAALPWDASGATGTKLLYKLPPSTLGAASSVKPANKQAVRAKTLASGQFARLAIAPGAVALWLRVGVPLDAGLAQTFKWGAAPEWDTNTDEAACRRKCEDSVVCWGLMYNADSRACLYRGGEDALGTRAFFVLPNTGGLAEAPPPAASPSPALVPLASPAGAPDFAQGDLPGDTPGVASPSPAAAEEPSPSPTLEPSPSPGLEPSPSPALEPSPSPVLEPSPSPALEPSPSPRLASPSPALAPSPSPALEPSPSPRLAPSPSPALQPSPSPRLASPSPALAPSPSPALEPSPALAPSPSPALEPSPSPRLASPSPALAPSPSPRLASPSPALEPSPSPRLASPSPALAPSPSPRLASPSPRPPSPSPALLMCSVGCCVRIRPTVPPAALNQMFINLAEVQLWAGNGTRMANSSIQVATSSQLPYGPLGWPLSAGYCNDGNTSTVIYDALTSINYGAGQICHTSGNDLNPTLWAQFPCSAGLSRVVLWNRWDGLPGPDSRIQNFTAEVTRDSVSLQAWDLQPYGMLQSYNLTPSVVLS